MGLLKRLVGEPSPSRDDLQRQADEEIKQMMGQMTGPPTDASFGQNGAEQAPPAEDRAES